MGFPGTTFTPIGIDVDSRSFRAIQMKRVGSCYHLTSALIVNRNKQTSSVEPAELTNLMGAIKRNGFHGKDVVLSVPEKKLLKGTFDLPKDVTNVPISQIVRLELARVYHTEPDSFEFIYWEPTKAEKSKSQAVAIGCSHETANTLLDMYEQAGFRVRAIDASSAAAVRACMPLMIPYPFTTAICDLRWDMVKLLIACGGRVVYERNMDKINVSLFVSSLINKYSITPEAAYQIATEVGLGSVDKGDNLDKQSVEAIGKILKSHIDNLTDDLRAPFSYANHQFGDKGIQRMLLIGIGGQIPGLDDYLHEVLDIEVMRACPVNLLESAPDILVKAGDPGMTVALGLAKFCEY
jgi:Tfp pilus assembly PilM family ATPase